MNSSHVTAPITHPRNRRILFVFDRLLSSFMERDWKLIQSEYPESELFCMRGLRDVLRLGHAVSHADLVLCWFGGSHAWWASVLLQGRCPLVIIAGGWDVANLPDINYGAHAMFPQANFSRGLFRRATRVLAVSECAAQNAMHNALVPKDRLAVIWHGFDPEEFPLSEGSRTRDVLTVTGTHAKVKGMDLLMDTAAIMPDIRFQVAGSILPADLMDFEGRRLGNVEFTGRLTTDHLRERMSATRVYWQPSRHESFGCALAEAMLTGCVPVATRTGALPEVMGDAGILVQERGPHVTAVAIRKALDAPDKARVEARMQIVNNFSLDKYRNRFLAELAATFT